MSSANTLQYGWISSKEVPGSLWFKFASCKSEPQEWTEELRRAAIATANGTNRPIWICLSGGIDSELICDTFYRLGIHFNVLIIEFKDGLNAHDIRWAKKWAVEHDIKPHIHLLDLQDFASKEIPRYIKEGYVASALSRYLQLKTHEIVEEKGGYLIAGWGEQAYTADSSLARLSPEDVHLNLDVGYAITYEWCKKNRTQHEGCFYFSTPEFMLSWLRLRMVDAAVNDPHFFRHEANRNALKSAIVRGLFPKMAWRVKYTGFEKVSELRKQTRESLLLQFGPAIQYFKISIPELRQQLSADISA